MELPEPVKDLDELPNHNRRRFWDSFMKKYDCQKIAEIGVYKGENFRRMVAHRPKIAVGVDIWKEEGIPGQNDSDHSQSELDAMYRNLCYKYREHPNIKFLRDYTVEAASIFPDGYLDFVYIDANHTYEGAKADVEAWFPKVREGGFVVGDDYWDRYSPKRHVRFGVVRAVNEFAANNGLTVYPISLHGWCILK